MPIYYKAGKRIMHAHPPKTGGSSIMQMAEDNGWRVSRNINTHEQHATYRVYRDWEYDAAFAIIRDPVKRMQSLLAMRLVPPHLAYEWILTVVSDHRKITAGKTEVEMAEMERNRWPGKVGRMAFPQCWYVGPGTDWAFYGEEDSLLEKHFGTSERQRVRLAPRSKYKLDDQTLQLVYDFYREDYETFGFDAPI